MKKMKMMIASAFLFIGTGAFTQVDYTFTNCGSTGQLGPSEGDAITESGRPRIVVGANSEIHLAHGLPGRRLKWPELGSRARWWLHEFVDNF